MPEDCCHSFHVSHEKKSCAFLNVCTGLILEAKPDCFGYRSVITLLTIYRYPKAHVRVPGTRLVTKEQDMYQYTSLSWL